MKREKVEVKATAHEYGLGKKRKDGISLPDSHQEEKVFKKLASDKNIHILLSLNRDFCVS